MTIRALLFDADEVIQHPDSDRVAQLERVLGFVPEPIAEFIAQLHAVEDTTLTGALELMDVLPPALARWGVADRALQVREWLTLVTVDREMLVLVSRLRQLGYLCLLATNQQPHRAHFMASELAYGEHFDRCFFSCELGLAKPDPRYFRAILTEMRLAPEQALFIDDKPQNVEGARSVGIHAQCFVNGQDGRAHLALAEVFRRFGVDC
ncbi:MAG: HAD family phosphatase [Myxococcales bacterium]